MPKRRASALISMFILGGIILSISCNLPSLSAPNSDNSKESQPVQSLDEAVEIVLNEVVQPEKLDHILIPSLEEALEIGY